MVRYDLANTWGLQIIILQRVRFYSLTPWKNYFSCHRVKVILFKKNYGPHDNFCPWRKIDQWGHLHLVRVVSILNLHGSFISSLCKTNQELGSNQISCSCLLAVVRHNQWTKIGGSIWSPEHSRIFHFPTFTGVQMNTSYW